MGRVWRGHDKIDCMAPRIVFMGSPEFALPSLTRLVEKYPVVGVVTQPDRPAGRGMSLAPPPVKQAALELGIPFIQPQKLKEPTAWEMLQAWQPDMIVVAAFGQILRQNVLDLPPLGCINVHGSLLPRWRGAAPIQSAILNGDSVTGVTIMKMDAGVDTGAILAQREEPILTDDTSGTLSVRLADLGGQLLVDTLPDYYNGTIQPVPQDESQVTKSRMIQKEDGLLDFNQPAQQLVWKIRAFQPWPGTFFEWQGGLVKVIRAHAVSGKGNAVGQRSAIQGFPAVACQDGWLVIDEIQPAGKKPMAGKIFLLGARQWAN